MQNAPQNPPHLVRQGLQHFNGQRFYAAHEFFEDAWRETPGEEREYYRALLQISGGFFRLSQGNAVGARKFFSQAAGWLAPFPDSFQGMDTATLRANLETILFDLDRDRSPAAILAQHFQPIQLHPSEAE